MPRTPWRLYRAFTRRAGALEIIVAFSSALAMADPVVTLPAPRKCELSSRARWPTSCSDRPPHRAPRSVLLNLDTPGLRDLCDHRAHDSSARKTNRELALLCHVAGGRVGYLFGCTSRSDSVRRTQLGERCESSDGSTRRAGWAQASRAPNQSAAQREARCDAGYAYSRLARPAACSGSGIATAPRRGRGAVAGSGSGSSRHGFRERTGRWRGEAAGIPRALRARASARAPALFDVCVSLSWPVLSNACPLRGQPCSGPRRPPTAGRFGSEPEARDRGGGRQQCLARKRLPFPWKHQRS